MTIQISEDALDDLNEGFPSASTRNLPRQPGTSILYPCK